MGHFCEGFFLVFFMASHFDVNGTTRTCRCRELYSCASHTVGRNCPYYTTLGDGIDLTHDEWYISSLIHIADYIAEYTFLRLWGFDSLFRPRLIIFLTMSNTELPSKDSADLYLVEATHEEITAQQHVNSDEWKGALNLEQYLRREDHLSQQDLTKDGGLTSWMLVYQPDANGPRQVVCGCETIKKRALLGKDGQVEDVSCHGVCSVFCPPAFRGRGYAGRMITDLGKRLDGWQAEDGKPTPFSVLYSDIGKKFYAARDWHVFPSSEVSLPATSSAESPPAGIRLLQSEDLAEFCALDEKVLRHRLSKSGKECTVAIVADNKTLAWHHAREDFVAQELYGKKPSAKGAVIGEPGQRIWLYWTRVWANPTEKAPNTLHILRLAFEDETWSDYAAASPEGVANVKDSAVVQAIKALFAVAQSEAASWQMKEVLLWNPSSAALAAAQQIDPKAAVVHREEDSITSLRWYGSGSSKDVKWEANEKYAWC